jgi:hypothetical protein
MSAPYGFPFPGSGGPSASSYTPTQQAAFTAATNISTAVGPDLKLAYGYTVQAVTNAREARDEMAQALADLTEVTTQIKFVSTWGQSLLSAGVEMAIASTISVLTSEVSQAEVLMKAYYEDIASLTSSLEGIQRLVSRYQLQYGGGVATAYKVNTCAKYRTFSAKVQGVPTAQRQLASEIGRINKILAFYGSDAGRQRRNQTKQLMTDTAIRLDNFRGLLTSLMRSGWSITRIRKWIDRNNGDPCGVRYSGSGPTPSNWNEAQANECHGLNKLAGILQYTAIKQKRSWTNYRMRWNSLSDSDKERNIVTGLDGVRSALKRLRNKKIPNARARFVNAFAGMSQVVGKTSAAFTSSQRRKFGRVAQLSLKVSDAFAAVANAGVQLMPYKSTISMVSNPMVIGCQSGSGYAGYGALEDKSSDWSPLLVMSGAVMLGMLGAHLHAKGI